MSLSEALQHDAWCSIFAYGTCDCSLGDSDASAVRLTTEGAEAEVTAPAVHERAADGSLLCLHRGSHASGGIAAAAPAVGSTLNAQPKIGHLQRATVMVLFGLFDMRCAESVRRGALAPSSAMYVVRMWIDIVREVDPATASQLVAEDTLQAIAGRVER